MIQNGIRTGVKLFFGSLIQRKEITLYMNLKLNLKGILGPKIENKLVPGAPTSWCDAYVNPTPLIAFGTPNNSVKASLSVSKTRLIISKGR